MDELNNNKKIVVSPTFENEKDVYETSERETNPYLLRKRVNLSFVETDDTGVYENAGRKKISDYELKNKVVLNLAETEKKHVFENVPTLSTPELIEDESIDEMPSYDENSTGEEVDSEENGDMVSPDISIKELLNDDSLSFRDYGEYTGYVDLQSTTEQKALQEENEPYVRNVSIAHDTVVIDVKKKEKKHSFLKWLKSMIPSKRRVMQLYTALLFNANLKGYVGGGISRNPAKFLCSPGINCYSCPGATGTCPLGALQTQMGTKSFPFYIVGILALYGIMFGRMICGWFCPFGLFQDLLHKIKTPKLGKSVITRTLSYFKYIILAVFVFGLAGVGIYPAFCKYICPAGILEGAFGLLPQNKFALLGDLGDLFTWKLVLAISIIVACIFVYRAFCRFICPLGAIYSLFNRFSFFGIKLNKDKCTSCGKCISKCKVDIKRVGDHECISCGECISVCPTKAISFKGPKVLLAPNEIPIPKDASKEEIQEIKAKQEAENARVKKKNRIKKIIAGSSAGLILGTLLVGTFVYHNFINDPPIWECVKSLFAKTEVGTEVGDKLPSMQLEVFDENGLTGEKIDPVTDGAGKVVVINFWGIYCEPCLQELPHFNKVASENKDDVVFYAIHYGSSVEKGMNHVKKHFSGSDMIFAKDTAADEYFDLVTDLNPTYPHTIVLNEEGIITYTSGATLNEEDLVGIIANAKSN